MLQHRVHNTKTYHIRLEIELGHDLCSLVGWGTVYGVHVHVGAQDTELGTGRSVGHRMTCNTDFRLQAHPENVRKKNNENIFDLSLTYYCAISRESYTMKVKFKPITDHPLMLT